MVTRIQKWGNSQGLRLPRHLLAESNIAVGDDVNVTVQDGNIIVSPVRPRRRSYNLEELISRIPRGDEPGELDWGAPAGRETW